MFNFCKLGITNNSTANQEEKQEERGTPPLAAIRLNYENEKNDFDEVK